MIGTALKYIRRKRNLKQNELAKIVSLDQTTLSKYELEKRDITFKNFETIANTCDFEIIIKDKKTTEEFKIADFKKRHIKRNNYFVSFFNLLYSFIK